MAGQRGGRGLVAVRELEPVTRQDASVIHGSGHEADALQPPPAARPGGEQARGEVARLDGAGEVDEELPGARLLHLEAELPGGRPIEGPVHRQDCSVSGLPADDRRSRHSARKLATADGKQDGFCTIMRGPLPRPVPIAVLFDLDGTLVDTVPFILAAVRHAFEGYGRCPTDAEWIAGIGTPLKAQLASFARRPEDVQALFDRYRA